MARRVFSKLHNVILRSPKATEESLRFFVAQLIGTPQNDISEQSRGKSS